MTFIVALVFGWEQACLHIMVVVIERSPNDFERIRVDSQELWLEAGIQPDQVLIGKALEARQKAKIGVFGIESRERIDFDELRLPCVDPVRTGVGAIIDHLLR